MPVLNFFLADISPFDQFFRLAKDATLPPLKVRVFDEVGTRQDLTGATATFTMTDVTGTDKVAAAAAVIEDATNGLVRYDWAAADTNADATYRGKFEITVSGKKYIVPNGTSQNLIIATGDVFV